MQLISEIGSERATNDSGKEPREVATTTTRVSPWPR